ncbi:MAG: acyltransferase [Clostridia bacterium]|nr:acyltransferase [Clostridia bacterium]
MKTGEKQTLPSASGREGNIELLRIVCMLIILGHHLSWHGAAMSSSLPQNQVIAAALFAGGMTGVNCFVMITGYFLAPFKTRRFVFTILQTLFYSVGLTLFVKYTGLNPWVAKETVIDSALIITRSPYWFVVMYLGLNAVLPLLQPAVKSLGRRAHLWILIVSALYLSVIPTVTFQNPSSQYFHQLSWFFFLYVLGAYFRKFPSRFTRCWPLHGAVFLGMLALITWLCLWGRDHQELFQKVGSRQNFFADKNAVPQLLCSCGLFLFFAGIKVRPSKYLTLLSGASFGVYLIHDHNLLRPVIWGQWVAVWQQCQTASFWKTALIIPPVIYLSCGAVDILRKFLLEKPLENLLNPAFEKTDRWLNGKTAKI